MSDQTKETTGDYPAFYTVHTPSGPTHACTLHAGKIKSLMNYMGVHVVVTLAPEDAQCANCINEAKLLPHSSPK